MSETATLILPDGKKTELPIIVGTEGELGLDIRNLRRDTGYIASDDAYTNVGSCQSAITFIDGEEGILRYRGYDIEEVAQKSDFVETAQLVIWGELPTEEQRSRFSDLLT